MKYIYVIMENAVGGGHGPTPFCVHVQNSLKAAKKIIEDEYVHTPIFRKIYYDTWKVDNYDGVWIIKIKIPRE